MNIRSLFLVALCCTTRVQAGNIQSSATQTTNKFVTFLTKNETVFVVGATAITLIALLQLDDDDSSKLGISHIPDSQQPIYGTGNEELVGRP